MKPLLSHPVDNSGTLVNIGHRSLMVRPFTDLVDATLEALKRELGPGDTVMVRGSIASGKAMSPFADADIVVVSGTPPNRTRLQAMAEGLHLLHPVVTEVDIAWLSLDQLLGDASGEQRRVNLATCSVCVRGASLAQMLPRYRPDAKLSRALYPDLPKELLRLSRVITTEPVPDYGYTPRDARFWCTWSMRTVLRGLHALVMARHGVYQAELRGCAANIAEALPEFSEIAKQALAWAPDPPDAPRVAEFLGRCAALVSTIAAKVYDEALPSAEPPVGIA